MVRLGSFQEADHLKWLEEHPGKKPKPRDQRKQVAREEKWKVAESMARKWSQLRYRFRFPFFTPVGIFVI